MRLSWLSNKQRAFEFETAGNYFSDKKPGAKLKRNLAPQTSLLAHSFLLLPHTTIALDGRNQYLYDAGNTRVKLAEDESGSLYAVKIIQDEKNHKTYENEFKIAEDVGAAVYAFTRSSQKKYYIVYNYYGQSLYYYLNFNLLSRSQQFDLAISLTLSLYNLHNGGCSKQGRGYVHYDIKPENVTLDQNGDVHLIDFGHSEEFSSIDRDKFKGSYLYIPYNHGNTSKESHDMFSLLRTLYMPNRYVTYDQTEGLFAYKTRDSTDIMIFNDLVANENSYLAILLNTENGLSKQFNCYYLLCALVLHKHGLYTHERLLSLLGANTSLKLNDLLILNSAGLCITQEMIDKLELNSNYSTMLMAFNGI